MVRDFAAIIRSNNYHQLCKVDVKNRIALGNRYAWAAAVGYMPDWLAIGPKYKEIRCDTIGEFNVDWKAEYSALSSTRSQKKKIKQTTPVPL